MPAKLIDGTAIGAGMRAELKGRIAALKARHVTPGLAGVLVGDNPASATYGKMKGKACEEAGLYHDTIVMAKGTRQADLLGLGDRINAGPKIHVILGRIPVPA